MLRAKLILDLRECVRIKYMSNTEFQNFVKDWNSIMRVV